MNPKKKSERRSLAWGVMKLKEEKAACEIDRSCWIYYISVSFQGCAASAPCASVTNYLATDDLNAYFSQKTVRHILCAHMRLSE